MSITENISQYTKNRSKYDEWKQQRNQKEQKKIEYLKNNSISSDEKAYDIKRAKAVLQAVNTMDEFSQTKAEEMEQATQAISLGAIQLGSSLSCALGYFFLKKKDDNALKEIFAGNFKNISKILPAALAIFIPFITTVAGVTFWGAKKEIEASRLGRTEAMTKDLASVNQFAVLTDEQEKEIENLSKEIEVTKKEIKKSTNAGRGFGIISSIKNIIVPDKKLKKELINHTEQVNNEIKKVDNVNLSQEEVEQAKKDKELIQNVVEKVDIKSQDYAENAELITGAISTASLGSGGILGLLLNKLLKFSSIAPNKAKKISVIVGLIASCTGVLLSTKVQMQASRVGRHIAKKELLNSPETLLYVDEEKYKDIKVEKQEAKKENFIRRTINLFKENKEYNEYIKNEQENNVKKRKALDKINLSDEQIKEAKQLQHNVFKMFNKVDEKSQSFSETIEATGDALTQLIGLLLTIPLASFYAKISKSTNKKSKVAILLLSIIPSVMFSIFLTKEQKKASRVADMMAIKELDNYKHFAPEEYYTTNNSMPKNIEKQDETSKNSDSESKNKENIQLNPSMQDYINQTKNKTI